MLFNLYICGSNKQQKIRLLRAGWAIYTLWIAPTRVWHFVAIYVHIPSLLREFCRADKSQESAALCSLSQYQGITTTTVIWPFDEQPLCLHIRVKHLSLVIIYWPLTFTESPQWSSSQWPKSVGVSVTVKTKVPAEIIQAVLIWRSRFKSVSFSLQGPFQKVTYFHICAFSLVVVIQISRCCALGLIWMTWFLVVRYMDTDFCNKNKLGDQKISNFDILQIS